MRGRQFNIPPAGETRFVNNELLLEFSSTSAQVRDALARSLQLTQLETQSFHADRPDNRTLAHRCSRSVRDTLRQIARNFPGVSAGQANMVYVGVQTQPTVKQDPAHRAPSSTSFASCILWKLTASTVAMTC